MPTTNGRTPEQVRLEIEAERQQLADAVEYLRDELGEATDITGKLRAKLPVVVGFGIRTPEQAREVAQAGVNGIVVGTEVVVAVLGAAFLYYGMKAVQLTGMSNRVWKRASEYNLILTERKRLAGRAG